LKRFPRLQIPVGFRRGGVIPLTPPPPRAFMACAGTFILPASWIFIEAHEPV